MNTRNKISLNEEDDSKVFVGDLPETKEYDYILYAAQDCGKYLDKEFRKSEEANQKAWSGILNLMGKCIARGIRLEIERRKRSENASRNPGD